MKGIKRTLGLALALTTLPSPVAAQNEILAEIPIELRGNRVIIPVSVGSSGPHRLILDTGMAYDGITLFDTASVDLSQFDHLARVQIRGAGPGGAAHALSDSAATFRAGPRTFKDQRVTMLTGGAFRGFPTDGVIGYSILGHHVVEIDYDTERMILYDPETFSPGGGGGGSGPALLLHRLCGGGGPRASGPRHQRIHRSRRNPGGLCGSRLEWGHLRSRRKGLESHHRTVPARGRPRRGGPGGDQVTAGGGRRDHRQRTAAEVQRDLRLLTVPNPTPTQQLPLRTVLSSCQVGPPDPEAGERVDTAGS